MVVLFEKGGPEIFLKGPVLDKLEEPESEYEENVVQVRDVPDGHENEEVEYTDEEYDPEIGAQDILLLVVTGMERRFRLQGQGDLHPVLVPEPQVIGPRLPGCKVEMEQKEPVRHLPRREGAGEACFRQDPHLAVGPDLVQADPVHERVAEFEDPVILLQVAGAQREPHPVNRIGKSEIRGFFLARDERIVMGIVGDIMYREYSVDVFEIVEIQAQRVNVKAVMYLHRLCAEKSGACHQEDGDNEKWDKKNPGNSRAGTVAGMAHI